MLMNKVNLAVATNTSYPNWYKGKLRSVTHTDKVRGDLSLEFFYKSSEAPVPVVVVDSGSSQNYLNEAKKLHLVRLIEKRKIKRSPSRRLAITTASAISGVDYIILTEPEKVSLITDCLPRIKKFLSENQVDLLIPGRQMDLWKQTYPKYMWDSEIEGNQLANEYLKSHGLLPYDREIDLFFGPRVLKNDPKIVKMFLKRYSVKLANFPLPREQFDVEQYSDTGIFPVVQVLKQKLAVKTLEVPFVYPKLQKENEEIGSRSRFEEKRKAQRLEILVELIHFLAYLEKNKSSRLNLFLNPSPK